MAEPPSKKQGPQFFEHLPLIAGLLEPINMVGQLQTEVSQWPQLSELDDQKLQRQLLLGSLAGLFSVGIFAWQVRKYSSKVPEADQKAERSPEQEALFRLSDDAETLLRREGIHGLDDRGRGFRMFLEIIPKLNARDRLDLTKRVRALTSHHFFPSEIRCSATQLFGEMILHLDPKDRPALVESFTELLGDHDWDVRLMVYKNLTKHAHELAPDLSNRVLKTLEDRLRDPDGEERCYAVETLGDIILELRPVDRLGYSVQVANLLRDEYWNARMHARATLKNILPVLDPVGRATIEGLCTRFAFDAGEKLGTPDEEVRSSSLKVIKDLIPFINHTTSLQALESHLSNKLTDYPSIAEIEGNDDAPLINEILNSIEALTHEVSSSIEEIEKSLKERWPAFGDHENLERDCLRVAEAIFKDWAREGRPMEEGKIPERFLTRGIEAYRESLAETGRSEEARRLEESKLDPMRKK